jgi:hypothetical protein
MVTMPFTGTFFGPAENTGDAEMMRRNMKMMNTMNAETRFTVIDKTSAIARISAAHARRKARCKFKTRSSDRFNKINIYRLDFLKQILVNKKMYVSIREYQIFFLWLIQSYAQRGPASADLQ